MSLPINERRARLASILELLQGDLILQDDLFTAQNMLSELLLSECEKSESWQRHICKMFPQFFKRD